MDHASGFVFIVPVVNFSVGEALRTHGEFEAEMSSTGVAVLNHHTDGVFSASQFQDKLAEDGQDMTFSGVGAHHQNAVAERVIFCGQGQTAIMWSMAPHTLQMHGLAAAKEQVATRRLSLTLS